MYHESELLEAEGLDLFEGSELEELESDFEAGSTTLETSVLPEPQVFGELEAVDESATSFDGFGERGGIGDFEDLYGESGDYEEASSWEVEFGAYEFGDPDPEAEIFGRIGSFVKRAARGAVKLARRAAPALARVAVPMFRTLAPVAAKVVGGALGGPAGAAIAGTVANAVLREAENETESAASGTLAEGDVEFEQAGGNLDAYELMEVYAAEAARAPSMPAADAAIVRMASASVRLFRSNARLRPVLPYVVKGAITLAMALQRNPQTRWAVRLVPLIVKRALTRLSRSARVTARAVIEAMAHETAWALANRARAIATLNRHRIALRRAPLHVRPRVRRPGMPIRSRSALRPALP